MQIYGVEFRCFALGRYAPGAFSIRDVAEDLEISPTTLVNWRRRLRETGSVAVSKARRGPLPTIGEPEQALLREWLAEKPDATLPDLVVKFAERNVKTSPTMLSRALKRMGISRKKRVPTLRSATAPT